MKKIYSLLAFLMTAMFMVACNNEPLPEPTPEPDGDAVKPEISIKEVSATEDSFTFELTSSVPGDYAYYCVDIYDVTPRPNMPEWFNENSGKVEDTTNVTIENLKAGVTYEVFVVVRATNGQLYSDVKKLQFSTKNSTNAGPITLLSSQHDRFAFKVNLSGYYRYFAKTKTEVESLGLSLETWIAESGAVAQGVKEYEYVNGEKGPDGRTIIVMPGATHIIGVWECDQSGNVYGDYSILEFDAPEAPESSAKVNITLSNITSTSVDVKCEPDAAISKYHILIHPKAQVESIVNNPQYGLNTLIGLMSTGYAWAKTSAFEDTWTGLIPDTEYCVCCLAIDNQGAQNFSYDMTFTSGVGSGVVAELDVDMTPNAASPSSSMDITISAKNVVAMRWAFNDSAAIDEAIATSDVISVAKYKGVALTAEQLNAALNGGLSVTMNDLWPEAEYAVVVYGVTAEQKETTEVVRVNTSAAPVPARVESSLFESLQGEWTLTYTYRDVTGSTKTIDGAVVNIRQGVDTKSEADYRAQNRLVITGWQFSDMVIPFNDVATLMESSKYWRDQYAPLAYRDYGPKVFLEIASGDVITMPTSKGCYLYHWDASNNILQFYGADLDKMQTAPVAFPVELSADGNTLTIKPYVSGEEFNNGTYYPSVFRGDEAWCVALGDITLTRK